jgi:hypothetical protein
MTYTDIVMNLTELQNITAPSINISSNASAIFGQMIDVANTNSHNLLGLFVMISILFIVYIALSDKSQNADFGYSDARAFAVSLGVALLIGLTEITAGITNNYLSIGTVTMLFLGSTIFIISYENKE